MVGSDYRVGTFQVFVYAPGRKFLAGTIETHDDGQVTYRYAE